MKGFKNVDFGRGVIVVSRRHLDPQGADVKMGELGVVFEESEYHEPNTGPMVRWFSGGACNVYDGDVVEHEPKRR